MRRIAFAKRGAVDGQMPLHGRSLALAAAIVAGDELIVVVDAHFAVRDAELDLSIDQAPRDRVQLASVVHVAVTLDLRTTPGHEIEAGAGQRTELRPLLGLEDECRLLACRAVYPLARDLLQPALEAGTGFSNVSGCVRPEVVGLHVADARLDLALLLRCAGRRRVDDEAVVAGQLPVAPVQLRLAVGAEGGRDHRSLQVVGHDHLRHPAERFEALDVQAQPCLDALVEDDACNQVTAEAEGHDEDPRLATLAGLGIAELADVAEVDLRDLARPRLHRDRDLLGPHPALTAQHRAASLHRRQAAVEVVVRRPQVVEDRRRADAGAPLHVDDRKPALHAAALLGGQLRQLLAPERVAQLRDVRQVVRLPFEQPGLAEHPHVAGHRVAAHPHAPGDAPGREPFTVESDQIL